LTLHNNIQRRKAKTEPFSKLPASAGKPHHKSKIRKRFIFSALLFGVGKSKDTLNKLETAIKYLPF